MISDPVIGADFLGREELLQTLKKRLESFKEGYRQNIAILGQPLLGKTSLVHHFLHTFEDNSILPIYVDVRPQALAPFVNQFCRAVLYQALRQEAAVGPQESLESLLREAPRVIPKTAKHVQVIQEYLRRNDGERAYQELLELTTHLHRETGRKCLVLLDEFHRLGDFSLKQPFQSFGKRIMVQKDTMYVILSSSVRLARSILAEKLSLLFGNFECLSIEPFGFNTACSFIQKKLEPVGIQEKECKYLIAFTDAHPFYLNVICTKLKELAEREMRPVVDSHLLIETFKRLMFDSEGILNQHFMQWISRWIDVGSRGSHLSILIQMANGVSKLKDLAHGISRNLRETSRQLNELLVAEQIAKSGVFYYFPDNVFRMWLRCVYQNREMSLLVDIPSKSAQFVSACQSHMEEFFEASKKPEAERIADLFQAFSNEIVEFDCKGKRLPGFKEVLAPRLGKDVSHQPVIAKGSNHRWICDVNRRRVTEEEVNRFMAESEALGDKKSRRVLITLRGMDQNARLLAKNTKIWTLSLQNINALMEFYGKSKIVTIDKEPNP